MPRRLPYLVIADDLTGSAEIAALGHQAGLRAAVFREVPRQRPRNVDLIVCDSGTRLDAPRVAARKVKALALRLKKFPHAGIFKKTDSVLRGNVMPELEACLAALGYRRALLVPCNPSLGRIISQGRYSIGGQPLQRTGFRHDANHPRKSADVAQLLGEATVPLVFLHRADSLPARGVALGEAASPADVVLWASRLDADTLPAGGADFFRMWLVQQHAVRHGKLKAHIPRYAPTLMLSGIAAMTHPVSPLPGNALELRLPGLPAAPDLARMATARLTADGVLSVSPRPRTKRSADSRLNSTYAALARRLRNSKSFDHILVAGATTAAAVLDGLGWKRLDVIHAWGPGTVSLQPAEAPRFVVTVKPGSYAWPVSLRRHFAPQVVSRPCQPAAYAAR